MTPHDLLANFEVLADAPGGVERLRELVVELAVRGKLVEQDPKDEPGSDLMKRIKAEKACHSTGKNQKKDAQSNNGTGKDDPPYALPLNWSWCRLADLCYRIHYGYTAPSTVESTHVRLVRITDIQNGSVLWGQVPGCEISEGEISNFLLHPRDILIARTGGTIGKTFLVGEVPRPSVFASYLIRAIPAESTDAAYLKRFCETPLYWDQLRAGSMGTGQPNVNASTLSLVWVPLPPREEQRRIVARVDELMALLDRLDAKRQEHETARAAARDSALSDLRDAPTPDDVEVAWLRIQDKFHDLFSTSEDITPLRQAAIDSAVRGRLVRQNPDHQPASELFREIQKEKLQIAKGTSKEKKEVQTNASFDGPFSIPKSWKWVSLGDIALSFRYGTSVKCSYEIVGEPVLRIPNVIAGRIDHMDLKYGSLTAEEARNLRLQLGDILLVRSNGSLNLVGRPALIEQHSVGYCYAGYLVRLRFSTTHVDPHFLLLALNTSDVREQIEVPIRSGVGLKNINTTEMSNLRIPLPPLDEQHLIVAQVKDVLTSIDCLTERLIEVAELSKSFASAAVHHLDS